MNGLSTLELETLLAEEYGIPKHIMKNFRTAINKSGKDLDFGYVLEDADEILDAYRHDPMMGESKVYDYLLSLGVKDCKRVQDTKNKVFTGFIFTTAEDFAKKYAPYICGSKTSPKDAVDLFNLDTVPGYYVMPLSDYEKELKERRKNLGNGGRDLRQPTIYDVHISKGY